MQNRLEGFSIHLVGGVWNGPWKRKNPWNIGQIRNIFPQNHRNMHLVQFCTPSNIFPVLLWRHLQGIRWLFICVEHIEDCKTERTSNWAVCLHIHWTWAPSDGRYCSFHSWNFFQGRLHNYFSIIKHWLITKSLCQHIAGLHLLVGGLQPRLRGLLSVLVLAIMGAAWSLLRFLSSAHLG